MLAYCPNLTAVIDRLKQLYVQRNPDIICAKMTLAKSSALDEFAKVHPEGFCDYPDIDERTRFWDQYCAERTDIFDDSIPQAYLSEFDQGLYGGLLGGDVKFLADPKTGWISSMVAPILKNWSDFDNLEFSKEAPWYKKYIAQLDQFTRAARGKFGISHFILINGFNFIFELVGATQTYMDVIDQPDRIRQALALAHDINLRIHNTFFDKVPLTEGGTISNMAQWLPGRTISESLDPFHMTSIDYFEQWGREPIENIFAEYDGGCIHIHSNGRHLLKTAATVKRLKAILLLDEKDAPPAFDVLEELKQKTGNVPLICYVDYPRFVESLDSHKLITGVFYKVTGTPDTDAANRTMDRVRNYK